MLGECYPPQLSFSPNSFLSNVLFQTNKNQGNFITGICAITKKTLTPKRSIALLERKPSSSARPWQLEFFMRMRDSIVDFRFAQSYESSSLSSFMDKPVRELVY
jgi:hypothetical protein